MCRDWRRCFNRRRSIPVFPFHGETVPVPSSDRKKDEREISLYTGTLVPSFRYFRCYYIGGRRATKY